MCGIAGFWAPQGRLDAGAARETLAGMTDAIAHRGPDATSAWLNGETGIALGHRRLSIVELSSAGAQPMTSDSGRLVIVYNGEIYNHVALRHDLEAAGAAPTWRGLSDTETLLAAIEAWGLEETLRRAYGMFALALWDRSAHSLTLARDRLGEKPLYFAQTRGTLLFGSELKALLAFPGFAPGLDPEAIDSFLRLSYIPAPRAIYQGVAKLMPGTLARFTTPGTAPKVINYWSLDGVIAETASERATLGGFDASAEALDAVLAEVVESQMMAEVPLGAFLSGGIDSSLITALMQERSARPVRTFSIGFDNARFNESKHAAAVADHLGTEHTELIVTEDDALALIPTLPAIYDEPFADSSQLPTALLCRLTRQHGLSVALSGDGGDEMFGGYNRHISGPRLWRGVSHLPAPLRRSLFGAVGSAEKVFARSEAARQASRWLGLPMTAIDRMGRFADSLGNSIDFEGFHARLIATGSELSAPGLADLPLAPRGFKLTLAEQMMRWDALTYLPDDIMVKVDRAAMAASLETRAPFLDARVVRAAWALPEGHRIGPLGGKSPLRTLLYRRVPRELIDRPKQGFAIPLDSWLRGSLRDWGEDLITSDTDLPGARAAALLWSDHQAGRRNLGSALWNWLMLAHWYDAVGRPGVEVRR